MNVEENDCIEGEKEAFIEDLVLLVEERRGATEPATFEHLLELLKGKEDLAVKISETIAFMKGILTEPDSPRFRDFWRARQFGLPLFREAISPKSRPGLWKEFTEITVQARQLKQILDEQSTFISEQIELAIQAIERDLEHQALALEQMPPLLIIEDSQVLGQNQEQYILLQKELDFLNTQASRINSLRKELIKTDIRIRTKNGLFSRLSLCGDRIFPRRKELIKALSDQFAHDVATFVEAQMQEQETEGHPSYYYAIREEIKTLQSIAKILTINTQVFTQTRLQLSACWDAVKGKEKGRQQELLQKKESFKQNFELARVKVVEFAQKCEQNISLDEVSSHMGELFDFLKTIELAYDQVRALKEDIYQAKQGIVDRQRAEEEAFLRKAREQEEEKRRKVVLFKEELQQLIAQASNQTVEALNAQKENLVNQMEKLHLNKAEKQMIDRLFKQLKDLCSEKKGNALLNLPEEELKLVEQLIEMLEERKERRTEIKAQLETYRKALSGSGFDFEKAMMYRELIEAEKSALDKVNSSIDEMEEKLAELEEPR